MDANTFEHDYIIKVLQDFYFEMTSTGKNHPEVIDSYARQLTAFKVGKAIGEKGGE